MYELGASTTDTRSLQIWDSWVDDWIVRTSWFLTRDKLSRSCSFWLIKFGGNDASNVWLRTDCMHMSFYSGEKWNHRREYEAKQWVCISNIVSQQTSFVRDKQTNTCTAIIEVTPIRSRSAYDAWLVITKVCYVLLSFGAIHIERYSIFVWCGIEAGWQNQANLKHSSSSDKQMLQFDECVNPPVRWPFLFKSQSVHSCMCSCGSFKKALSFDVAAHMVSGVGITYRFAVHPLCLIRNSADYLIWFEVCAEKQQRKLSPEQKICRPRPKKSNAVNNLQ